MSFRRLMIPEPGKNSRHLNGASREAPNIRIVDLATQKLGDERGQVDIGGLETPGFCFSQ